MTPSFAKVIHEHLSELDRKAEAYQVMINHTGPLDVLGHTPFWISVRGQNGAVYFNLESLISVEIIEL